VGYLESGLQSSYESIMLGDHLVSYARAFMAELRTDDEALALDEIIAVGPGGNHLARPYTRRHFREIWQSDLFETTVYDRWRSEGSATLLDRLRQRRGGAARRAARFPARRADQAAAGAASLDAAAAERPEA